VLKPTLTVDWEAVKTFELNPADTPISAELAPAVGGAADLSKVTTIDLEKLPEEFRLQRLVFRAALKGVHEYRARFRGNVQYLTIQLVRIVETFLRSDRLRIPTEYHNDPLRRRILIALNLDQIVQHLLRHVSEQNQERLEPVFDEDTPIGSTGRMRTWYTTRIVNPTRKSHISHVVVDGAWEQYTANALENSPLVSAWAKNDHLEFHIYYLWQGARRRYIPDFLIRLSNGRTLVLEVKGQDSEQDRAKRAALATWVSAVNLKGGFGVWCCDVAFQPAEVHDILVKFGAP